MYLTDKVPDFLEGLKGSVKALISRMPGLGEAVAGWDAYKRSSFERNVKKVIEHLKAKIDDIEEYFKQDYFKTEHGEKFVRKVFDAAFDTQLEDKQELFINALINGVNDKTTPELEKLKFIDILRHLSRASLMILAEMHKMLIKQVRGPNRQPDPTSSYPLVNPSAIAEGLSKKYDPYLVTSSISEMESQGLFSSTGEWRKDPVSGIQRPGGGFATEMCYTDFAARFVEFITTESISKISNE
jgi:hypothetical protein